jgi:hypothetical protein
VEKVVPQYKQVFVEKPVPVEVLVPQIEYVDVHVAPPPQYRKVAKYVPVDVEVAVQIPRPVEVEQIKEVFVDTPVQVPVQRQVLVPKFVTKQVPKYYDVMVDEPVEQVIKSVRQVQKTVKVEKHIPELNYVLKTEINAPLVMDQQGNKKLLSSWSPAI